MSSVSSGPTSPQPPLLFDPVGARAVVADFSGGTLSTDGGVLLLRQIDRGLGLTRRLATCFHDQRDPDWVDHTVEELLAQRIHGLALGYEDLNDHEQLRRDPLLAVACGKPDPLGQDRFLPQFRGVALAGPSTLNRLELSNNQKSRCHKLPHEPARVEACLLEMGVRCLPKQAREIVLDLDAMGHLLHGTQEGRHFSGYYGDYCYLPLYVFAGTVPLWAQLRGSDTDAAEGVVPALAKIVAAIRQRCPQARILVRGDSGFCREAILVWCEGQPEVYYCLGLAKNSVLIEQLGQPGDHPAPLGSPLQHLLAPRLSLPGSVAGPPPRLSRFASESVGPCSGSARRTPVPHTPVFEPRERRAQGPSRMNDPLPKPDSHSATLALTRFRALNYVEDQRRAGRALAAALRAASLRPWPDDHGDYYAVRTLEDWWYAYQKGGFDALVPSRALRPGPKPCPR